MRKLFNQKFVQSVVSGPDAQFIVADRLEREAIQVKCVSIPGTPCAADFLVYSATQRILGISTHAGYVKLIGGQAVDTEIRTGNASQTLSLENIPFAGAMLRVSEGGEVELLPYDARPSSVLHHDDVFTCASAFPSAPYVALGCLSGALRIAALQGLDAHRPWVPGTPAGALSMSRYAVSVTQLQGLGQDTKVPSFGLAGVAAVAVHSAAEQHLALLAFMNRVVSVWDFRSEQLLALVCMDNVAGLEDIGPPSTATWLASGWLPALGVATGHRTGHILVWALPQGSPAATAPPPAPQALQLLMKLRCVPDERPATAISRLLSIPAASLEQHRMLVFGGQAVEEPQQLTIFSVGPSLAAAAAAGADTSRITPATSCESQALHWFGTIEGFAMVGSRADPLCRTSAQGVMVLTEGGQLMMHELEGLQPQPIEMPYSCLSRVTAACWASTQPASQSSAPCSLTLPALTALGKRLDLGPQAALRTDLLDGGKPADLDADAAHQVYVTGHNDGSVRLWLLATSAPQLCAVVEVLPGTKSAAAQVIQLCSASGLLAVGRRGGTADLFQLHGQERVVALHELDVGSTGSDASGHGTVESVRQDAGFQLVLRVRMPSAVTAVELASRHRLLVVGDESGSLLGVDLSKPAPLMAMQPGIGPIGQLSLVYSLLAATDRRKSLDTRKIPGSNMPKLVLLVAAKDSTLLTIDMERREPLGKPLKPKTTSSSFRCLSALDLQALNTSTIQKPVELPWACPDLPQGLSMGPEGPLRGGPASEHSGRIGDDEDTGCNEAKEGDAAVQAATFDSAMAGDYDNFELASRPGQQRSLPCHTAFSGAGPPADAAAVIAENAECTTSTAGEVQSTAASFISNASHPATNPFATATNPFVGGGDPSFPQSSQTSPAAQPSAPRANGDKADASPGHLISSGAVSNAARSLQIVDRGSGRLAFSGSSETSGSTAFSEGPSGGTRLRQSFSERFAPRAEEGSTRRGSLGGPVRERTGGSQAAVLTDASFPPMAAQRASTLSNPQESDQLTPYASANFDELDGGDQPTIVAYVVSVTEQYARLYHFDHVRSGDRTAMHKVTFQEPVAASGTFHTASGPGLACVTFAGNILIYALPSLTLLQQCSIDAITGAKWASSNEKSWLQSLDSARFSQNGQLLVFGPFGHMARLTLTQDTQGAIPCNAVVDWDVEKAVHTTCELQAQAAQSAALTVGAASNAVSESGLERVSMSAGASGLASSAAAPGKAGSLAAMKKGGFGGFLSSVVTKVVDVGADMADSLQQKLRIAEAAESKKDLPTIDTIFAKHTSLPPVPGQLATHSQANVQEALSTAASSSSHTPADAAQRTASIPSASPEAADRRALLGQSGRAAAVDSLGGSNNAGTTGSGGGGALPSSGVDMERITQASRAAGPDGKPRARTIEEIRAAYGIKHKKADTVQGVMAENAELLAQRGEKLKQLDERTAQMQEEAQNFANMAKKLAEGENKKWWQL